MTDNINDNDAILYFDLRDVYRLFPTLLAGALKAIRDRLLVFWTLAGGLIVLLGALYSWFFFTPLGIPILDLAAPSDFLLPGLRHALVLLVFAIITALAAVAPAFFLVSLIFVFLQHVLARLIRSVGRLVKFLLRVVGFAMTGLFAVVTAVCWALPVLIRILAYRTTTSLSRFLRSVLARFARGNNQATSVEDRSSIFSDIEELRNQYTTLVGDAVERVKQAASIIDDCTDSIEDFLVPKGITGASLKRLAVVFFALFAIPCVLGATYIKADRHSELVLDVRNAANAGADCLDPDAIGSPIPWSKRVDCLYHWAVWPMSSVTVQFQDNPGVPENLLHLGVTSSFMLFWLVEDNGVGRPLIVPKSFVRRIFPGSAVADIEMQDSSVRIVEELRELNESLPDVIDDADLARLALFLASEMECGNEIQVKMSELIHFARNSDEIRAQQRLLIGLFALGLEPSDVNLKVFAFASPDGVEASNSELAESRGERVFAEMQRWCERIVDGCPAFDQPVIVAFGEDHFINGVANSRSAIMAVCDSP